MIQGIIPAAAKGCRSHGRTLGTLDNLDKSSNEFATRMLENENLSLDANLSCGNDYQGRFVWRNKLY